MDDVTLAATSLMFALAAILVVVLVVALRNVRELASQSLLRRWAEHESVTLVHVEPRGGRRRGPFYWGTSGCQTVYRVVALGPNGEERTGWLRCGHGFFGLMLDQVEARWDEVPAVPSKPASPFAKPTPLCVWDHELDVVPSRRPNDDLA